SDGQGRCCGQVFSCIFDYDTPRIALIKSRKVGLLNRIIQLESSPMSLGRDQGNAQRCTSDKERQLLYILH
ncbi:hypothetical protein GDO86_019007, partial [Hymenochirus boettgeri]